MLVRAPATCKVPIFSPSIIWFWSSVPLPCAVSARLWASPLDPPTSTPPVTLTAGIRPAMLDQDPLLGISLKLEAVSARVCVAPRTSTIGDSPLTVTVSARPPTARSAFAVVVKLAVTSRPSRLTTLNPGSVKVTVNVPTGRLTMA